MKRPLILPGLFLGLSLLCLPAWGQDAAVTNAAADAATNAASKAAAVAEQQGMDERFKQLAADIETLRAANQLLLDKLSALKDDLQEIHAEQARLAANAIGREDLKPLAQRIEEVDKKRQEDKDAISEEIKKSAERVESLLTNAAAAASKPPAKPPGTGGAPAAENGFQYTMKEGDTLDAIVAAYNAEFQKKGMKTISVQQAKDANPGIVDWNRVRSGHRIVIPHPAE
ncbi:MAG: hypothetical protein ABSC18_14865 [Verrucomicrobiota bacterium]|jgi:phage tail protein X